MKSLTLSLIFILLLTSCGSKPEARQSKLINTFFVNGDPGSLYEGAISNNQSFISEKELEAYNGYTLANIYQFTQEEEVVEEQVANIEEGQEAPATDISKDSAGEFGFRKENSVYVYSSFKEKMALTFKAEGGKLNLIKLETTEGQFDLKVIHYSQKNSKDAFSILAETLSSDDKKILLAFTFVKKTEQKFIARASQIYKYLLGPGVKTVWNQNELLQVNICGKQPVKVEEAFKSGIAMWNDALKNRLTVKTAPARMYPPFSDLNSHCIYTVNNYLTTADPDAINSASTAGSFNSFKGEIIDSDILVWVKEVEKFGVKFENAESLKITAAHEFGHLLGLHHQFDKDYPSIMSYDGTRSITQYDLEAIANLYPLNP